MIFYCDDNEFVSGRLFNLSRQDVYCIGGFGVKDIDTAQKAMSIFENIKSEYKIPLGLPFKWNMKDDRVVREYKKLKAEDKLNEVIANISNIRKKVFEDVSGLYPNLFVVTSAIRNLGIDKNEAYKWCFTYLLQRVAFEFTPSNYNLLCIDWEDKRRDDYCSIYQAAYREGRVKGPKKLTPISEKEFCIEQGYISFKSGALSQFPASASLHFSVTVFEPLLQIADFFIGCVSDFFEWCFKNKGEQLVRKYFPYIKNCFRRSPAGEIMRWGIIFQPVEDEPLVKRKLEEI